MPKTETTRPTASTVSAAARTFVVVSMVSVVVSVVVVVVLLVSVTVFVVFVVSLVVSLLESRLDGPPMARDDALFAAGQFIQMIISGPQRRALSVGEQMPPAEQAEWVRRTTRLFLTGVRGWTA